MTTLTQSLPPITSRVRLALRSTMRDFYNRVGQYLPTKSIQPKSQYVTIRRTPIDLTVIERPLWEQIPHEYYYFHPFFSDTPQFIGSYFARKYGSLYQERGSRAANTYLRTCGLTRCAAVQRQYTIKNAGQSLIAQHFYKQLSVLPTLDRDAVNELGSDIASYMQNLIIKFSII